MTGTTGNDATFATLLGNEGWLFKNKAALKAVSRGLADDAHGEFEAAARAPAGKAAKGGSSLLFTRSAAEQRELLRKSQRAQRGRAVERTLALLRSGLEAPGLAIRQYESLSGPRGEDMYVACASDGSESGLRLFCHRGPSRREIVVVALVEAAR